MRREDTALCEDVNDALADMVETGAWRRAVRANLGTSWSLPTRTLTPPTLRDCPAPRTPSPSASVAMMADAASTSTAVEQASTHCGPKRAASRDAVCTPRTTPRELTANSRPYCCASKP